MIAVPITAAGTEEALADIEKANQKAGIIELRLDFLQSLGKLEQIVKACAKPVIATFREENFGKDLEPRERMAVLKQAIGFGAAYFDLDVKSDKGFVEEMSENKGGAKMILSSHDFEKTPSTEELGSLLESMANTPGCDIVKIVAFANSEEDNERMLALIPKAKAIGKPIVAFCMGAIGKKSRIDSIKLGAFLSFASLGEGKESAPGQITLDEMREGASK